MRLDTFSKWAETINYIAGTAGIIAGGAWVYWKYVFHREGKWNLKLELNTESIQYGKDKKLLKVNVTLRNEGNSKICPGNKGCRLTVRKLDSESAKNHLIDFKSGEPIVNDHDILNKYFRKETGYKTYVIEPKAEYHEVEAVLVTKGDLLSIRVEFFWIDDEDSITEYGIHYVE